MSQRTSRRTHAPLPHRPKPRLRPRRERRTILAAGVVDSERAPLQVDEALWNGFVYAVGLHARNPAVTIHDLSFDGFSYWILLTADPVNGDAFLGGLVRDFAGFLRAYTGDDELRIHPDLPIPIRELAQPTEAGPTGPC